MKQTAFITLLVTFLAFAAAGQAPTVSKIEPPNWFAEHTINPVRILIAGQHLSGAKVSTRSRSIKISSVRTSEKGTYLFFDLNIQKSRKVQRSETIFIETPGGRTSFQFDIAPAAKKANIESIGSDDIIYLIMTDRFADGDQTNNLGVDRRNPRAWHGGDFKGIEKKIPYLKELGVTAIWLTPWYDNPDGANECSDPWCPYTNYHGYHAVDYYATENHFGSFADLQRLIRECNRNGIKVIQDQVANHVGLQHPWAKDPPIAGWFNPFTKNAFKNSALLSPNSADSSRDNLLKGWFNEFLPDLNQDEPEVEKYLIQNALWWIGMTGVNGIRQDTIQYMPRTFIRDWSAAIKKQYPNYWMVGEIFEEDSVHTAFFQGGRSGWDGIDTGLPSVFDFKLWRTSQEVFSDKKPIRALRDVMKYDGLYPNINNVTVLANNHDTDRFMSLPDATIDGAMLHTAFVLSTRGIPQLYYGEEIAMIGGHDPDNRRDFPGGFPGDELDAFAQGGRTVDQQRMFDWTKQWIAHRRKSTDVSVGKTIDVFYDDTVYVFVRDAQSTKGLRSLIAFNKSSSERTIRIEHPSLVGKLATRAELDPKSIDGEVTLTLAPKSASAYLITK